MTDILNQNIELLIDNFVREQNIPSLEVAISDSQNDFFKYKAGVYVSKDESYEIGDLYFGASISKTITSFSIYYLICNNVLSLHDRILEILPFINKYSNIDENCRLLDLLTHSGGIVEIPYNWDNKDNNSISPLESFQSGDYKFLINQSEIGKFGYGNIGYDILGAVIEKVSGFQYHDFVKKYIFDPVGIKNTFYIYKDIPKEKLAKPYIQTNMELLPICGYPVAIKHNPSAVMYTNISDLTQLGRLHLNLGKTASKIQLIQPECYKEMWHKHQKTTYSPNKHYGIGWFLGEFGNIKVIGHGGREYGFNSLMIICPQFNVTYSILMNVHTADSLKLAMKILGSIISHVQKNLTMVFS